MLYALLFTFLSMMIVLAVHMILDVSLIFRARRTTWCTGKTGTESMDIQLSPFLPVNEIPEKQKL